MELSRYHQKYADLPEEEIVKRVAVKEEELKAVFAAIPLIGATVPAKVAVMGCGDKRFVAAHKEMFSRLLQRQVTVTTFDITIDHLVGGEGVVQHDCTIPLPDGPYDITYAHVLLKFIGQSKQIDVLRNSYTVLQPGGLAIHVLDTEDYSGPAPAVPLETYTAALVEEGVLLQEVPVRHGRALILHKAA